MDSMECTMNTDDVVGDGNSGEVAVEEKTRETEDSDIKQEEETDSDVSPLSIECNVDFDVRSVDFDEEELTDENILSSSTAEDGDDESAEGDSKKVQFGIDDAFCKYNCVLPKSITVQSSCAKESRRNYCPFCLKAFTKLPRHMIKSHKSEKRVKEFLAQKKNSVERNKLLSELRLLGNFKHNSKVIERGKGEIIPAVRPKTNEGLKYVPCRKCFGFFPKKLLWKHSSSCTKTGNEAQTVCFRRVVGQGMNLFMHPSINKSFLEKIIGPMVTDHVNIVIRNDPLILKYGQKIFEKDPDVAPCQIQYRLRELGRLLVAVKEVDPKFKSLKDMIQPTNFDTILYGAKRLCCLGKESQKEPLFRKVGSHLKYCLEIIRQEAEDGDVTTEDDDKADDDVTADSDVTNDHFITRDSFSTDNYIKSENNILRLCAEFSNRYDKEWMSSITPMPAPKASQKKVEKVKFQTLVQEFQTLYSFIDAQIRENFNKLLSIKNNIKEEIDPTKDTKLVSEVQPVWGKLTKLILTGITIFNRNNLSQVEKMKIEDFQNGFQAAANRDVKENQLLFLEEIQKEFYKVEIKGRYGRRSTFFLSEWHVCSVRLLVEMRKLSGVSPKNDFVFARMNCGSMHSLRSRCSMREILVEAGLKNSEYMLRSNAHKYITVMSQIMNLYLTELQHVLCFVNKELGVDIHSYCVSLRNDPMQLGKLTKVLLSLQNRTDYKYQSLTLPQIQLDPEELISDGSDDEGDEEKNVDRKRPQESVNEMPFTSTEASPHTTNEFEPKRKTKPFFLRRYWTEDEQRVATAFFESFLNEERLPGKAECVQFLEENPTMFIGRKWTQVKDFVRNKITAMKREAS